MIIEKIGIQFCNEVRGKKQKTEKRTHFAVTQREEKDYRDIFGPKKRLGTKYCSKIVENFPGFRPARIKIMFSFSLEPVILKLLMPKISIIHPVHGAL
jgi:hypothetical protein